MEMFMLVISTFNYLGAAFNSFVAYQEGNTHSALGWLCAACGWLLVALGYYV